jgi:hypothetical protein
LRIRGANGVEEWLQKVRYFGFETRVEQPSDTVLPLTGPLRLFGRQIVETDAGMGVDHPEGFVLELQIFDDAGEDRMLDHIGEVPGVIGVAVVHGSVPVLRF